MLKTPLGQSQAWWNPGNQGTRLPKAVTENPLSEALGWGICCVLRGNCPLGSTEASSANLWVKNKQV